MTIQKTAKICKHAVKGLAELETELHKACDHIFVPFDLDCPRLLTNDLTSYSGFGHQTAEILFALRKSFGRGLSYAYEPVVASGGHKDDYASADELLGLSHMFKHLGGVTKQRAIQLQGRTKSKWMELSGTQLVPPTDCYVFQRISGFSHCISSSNENCFKAPENEHIYQDAARCFRTAVLLYGSAFDRCIFDSNDLSRGQQIGDIADQRRHSHVLPNDTIIIVWHVRLGDRVLHKPDDPSFARVLSVLRQIIGGYKPVILLVGKAQGTNETHGVSQDYVKFISEAASEAWADSSIALAPHVMAPRYSFKDALVAMMQADVLIGSGSALPQAAALFSGVPLYFNHVAKHGYNYGAEMLADSVDMHPNGSVSESLRRLKVAIYDRMRPVNRRVCR